MMKKKDLSQYTEQMNDAVRSAATSMREKRYHLLKGTFANAQRMLERLESQGMDEAHVTMYKKLLNSIYDRDAEKCAELGLERYPID